MPAVRPRFAADEMLGSLARWLRIMGYDTVYERDRTDSQIVETARKEERVILTRDWELAGRMGERGLYIESDDLDDQLRQVTKTFDLNADESQARCTVCNGELASLPKEGAKGMVPEGVLANNHEFFRCLKCGKIYWKGSHWSNIRRRFQDLDKLVPNL